MGRRRRRGKERKRERSTGKNRKGVWPKNLVFVKDFLRTGVNKGAGIGHNAGGWKRIGLYCTPSATSIDLEKNNPAVLIAPKQLLNGLLMPADFCLFLGKMEFTLRYGMTMGQPSRACLGAASFCCLLGAGGCPPDPRNMAWPRTIPHLSAAANSWLSKARITTS